MSVHMVTDWSPSEIIRAINDCDFGVEKYKISAGYRSFAYIICGKPGPTGKSWLYYRLLEYDYKAYELSEDMVGLVSYYDDKNHIIINNMNHSVLIVLNKPFERK